MSYYSESSGNQILPPVIKNVLIANGMLFFFQVFFAGQSAGLLMEFLALWPLGIDESTRVVGAAGSAQFYPWQLLTYGFLHDPQNFFHIFFNMLALWMFGREIELSWGSQRFAIYYLICVAGAGLVQLGVSSFFLAQTNYAVPTIGASGGTYGVLLAFGMMFPYRRIMLLFPPIPMQARWFVIVFGGLELIQGLGMRSTGVAHWAHLGGMFFGLLLILFWRGKLPIKPKRRMHW